MSDELKEVKEAVEAVVGLKEDARRLRSKISDATTRGQNAMGRVETAIVDPLLAAVVELEALTNTQTNE